MEKIIGDILKASFLSNNSTLFVTGTKGNWQKRLSRLIDYSIRESARHGGLHLSRSGRAAALMFESPVSSPSLFSQIQLLFGVVGLYRLSEVLKKETLVKSRHPSTPYYNLWFIGVRPEDQGKGEGSALMEELTALADRRGLPIYMETSVASNVPFYEKFGFSTYETADFGFSFHMMKRDPVSEEGKKSPAS